MVETHNFQRLQDIRGENAEDTRLLRSMSDAAVDYISSHDWCPPVSDSYLAFGVGGVIAVFFIAFETPVGGTDAALWVIVGDLPNAYVVCEDTPTPGAAMKTYLELMEDWVTAVYAGQDLSDVFPVAAEPTIENAHLLKDRIAFIRENILPSIAP